MAQFEHIATLEVANQLGECVLWNERDGCVWWTDILSCRLYRYHLAAGELSQWATPERLCAFGFTDDPDTLVCAFESGFAYARLPDLEPRWLDRPEVDIKATRFNDGRVDRQGRFWCSTMVEQASATDAHGQPIRAGLYCLQSGGAKKLIDDVGIGNALCWSTDSRTLYFADSTTGRIESFDFDADTASLNNRRTFATLPEGIAPDGACIDSRGGLWNAEWQGSRVTRYHPDGSADCRLELPVSQVTCVALGGPDLDHLFVTSARVDLDDATLAAQPLAGSLFIYRGAFRGLLESRHKMLV